MRNLTFIRFILQHIILDNIQCIKININIIVKYVGNIEWQGTNKKSVLNRFPFRSIICIFFSDGTIIYSGIINRFLFYAKSMVTM